MIRRHVSRLRSSGQLRWSRGATIAFCSLLGTLLPAVFGLQAGIPQPLVHDEVSYILGAETFASGRLTNPPLALPEFFETPHVLVVPSYQSKYPPGQAIVLAIGEVLLGHPIWGVWIGCGLFAGSLCWMLQTWVPRRWAVVVTVLSSATLGTTTYWAQSYWGGMIAAAGAALAFGGIRRTLGGPTVTSSTVVGVGVVVLTITRPFEGALALLPSVALLGRWVLVDRALTPRQKLRRFVLPAGAVMAIGFSCLTVYHHAVTGNPWRTPYEAHLDQYFEQGVFLFSPLQQPERSPSERIAKFYRTFTVPPVYGIVLIKRVSVSIVERFPSAFGSAFGFRMRPTERGPYYTGVLLWTALLVPLLGRRPGRTFFPILAAGMVVEAAARRYLPAEAYPLWLGTLIAPFLGVMLYRGSRRSRWTPFFAATMATIVVGQAFVPWWFPHYTAPMVPIVMAAVATSVHRAAVRSRVPADWVGLAVMVALGAHLFAASFLLRRTEPAPTSLRNVVINELVHKGGNHLVFVRYDSDFTVHQEFVYNSPDLAAARVIFAHDLGAEKNPELMARYGGRSAWLLHVSTGDTRLETYPSDSPGRDEKDLPVLHAVTVRDPWSLMNVQEFMPEIPVRLGPHPALALGRDRQPQPWPEVAAQTTGDREFICFDPGPHAKRSSCRPAVVDAATDYGNLKVGSSGREGVERSRTAAAQTVGH